MPLQAPWYAFLFDLTPRCVPPSFSISYVIFWAFDNIFVFWVAVPVLHTSGRTSIKSCTKMKVCILQYWFICVSRRMLFPFVRFYVIHFSYIFACGVFLWLSLLVPSTVWSFLCMSLCWLIEFMVSHCCFRSHVCFTCCPVHVCRLVSCYVYMSSLCYCLSMSSVPFCLVWMFYLFQWPVCM
jgi:hypothetical protein